MNKDPQALIKNIVNALTQILDDGDHIAAYDEVTDEPTFNRNGKQGYYCYAAAEQAMDALTAAQALQEVFGDGWQDISTAPRDGTRILLCDSAKRIHISWWGEIDKHLHYKYNFPEKLKPCWLDEYGHALNFCSHTPTHWMPLPKSPTKE